MSRPEDRYAGWSGQQAHPNAPAGGTGPGYSRSAFPTGVLLAQVGTPQPESRKEQSGSEGPPKRADVPDSLVKCTESVNGFAADELNEALLTVFGELSAERNQEYNPRYMWQIEAEAIASTIFNRKTQIEQARAAYDEAEKNFADANAKAATARQAQRKAEQAHDGLKFTNPNKLKGKELEEAKAKFQEEKKRVKDAYNQAVQDRNAADKEVQRLGGAEGGALRIAKDKRTDVESFLSPNQRRASPVTLTLVVTASRGDGGSHYVGYRKGKKDFEDYPKSNKPDKERNSERWEIAKTALQSLAQHSGARSEYLFFLSNRAEKRAKKPNEYRIGGNDFSVSRMED